MERFAAEKIPGQDPRVRRVLIVLGVLLLLSLIALAAVVTHGSRWDSDTDISADNRVGSLAAQSGLGRLIWAAAGEEQETQQETALALYRGHGQENIPFQVRNMLPGDGVTRRFAVEVSHKETVQLYFQAQITRQTKELAKALTLRVVHLESGRVLYEGSFGTLAADGYALSLDPSPENKTVATFEIQVGLPTHTGNAYQQATLSCDFCWYVADQGSLTPPQTGDAFPAGLWGALALVSAGGIAALAVLRKKEAAHA